MGRLARSVVHAAQDDPRFEPTFLVERAPDERVLREEFPTLPIFAAQRARAKSAFDLVWYPWNGMRWRSAASTVVTICDAFAFTEPHRDAIARYREQSPIRQAARAATFVATISSWSRDEIVRELHVARERISVVPPAPDPFFFPSLGDPMPAGLEDARVVLLVGAREKRKNARVAIEACARAFAHPDERLVVVGELNSDDRKLARRLGLAAGEIAASDETLRALYRNAALVLVPSLAEGFGLVAVEALACAAPVVASDASALPEATRGAAALLPPLDVARWAGTIRGLLDDPVGAQSLRARAAATFAFADRGAYARGMLDLFERTANFSPR
jgi:glycosyltransferase involved in cell wall biosynthesis